LKKNNLKPKRNKGDNIKDLWQNINKDRWKIVGFYTFDRWIFQAMMLIVFSWLFFVAWQSNYELDYYECGEYAGCKNPFYKPATWKNEEILPQGVYGKKPGLLFKSAIVLPIVLFFLALLINHVLYNRGTGRLITKKLEEIANTGDE